MIHRRPLAAKLTKPKGYRRLSTPIQCVQRDPFNVRLTPKYISSIPFPTILRQSLPTKHNEIYGVYNTACTFIKHMKYDKAELVEADDVLRTRTECFVCNAAPSPKHKCYKCLTAFCTTHKTKFLKHKKTCKPPTTPPATEANLRTLHKGMLLLNRCIQENGAGDGPTSEVLEFLLPDPAH